MKGIIIFLSAILAVNCNDKLDAKKHLLQYGYLDQHQYGGNSMSDAVSLYQLSYGLKVTGVVDKETIHLMKTPRCGMKDNTVRGYADTKWNKKSLSYYFYNYTPDLPKATIEERTARALRYWSDVSQLKFTKQQGSGDLVFAFGSKVHRDKSYCRNKFDGPGKVLAHAFFPSVGRLHFDDDELYTAGTLSGINYLWVATHELGHALGLEHDTKTTSAVMYPYYRGYIAGGMKLHANDIARIQKLYGSNTPRRTPNTPRRTPPPRIPGASYILVGNGKMCTLATLYTYTGYTYCDGWHGTTLAECKDKCSRNAVPPGCTHISKKRCHYLQWKSSNGWCHLADTSCKIINIAGFQLYQQQTGCKDMYWCGFNAEKCTTTKWMAYMKKWCPKTCKYC